MTPAFNDLFNQHVAASFDRQLFLADQVGKRPWTLDVDKGTICFGEDIQWQVQLLGTEGDADQSWLWAWANKASPLPKQLLVSANSLYEFGKSKNVPELMSGKLPTGVGLDGHLLSVVASGVCGANAYYRVPFEGGAIFVLIQDPEYPPNIIDPAQRVYDTFIKVITKYSGCHHRKAFLAYLDYYALEKSEEGSKITVVGSGRNLILVDFTPTGRLIAMQRQVASE